MKRWLSFFALIGAFALGTIVAWWMVPVIAGLWGVLRPRVNAPAATAALAAGAAWALWLLFDWQASHGGMGALAGRLGNLMHIPPLGLAAATVLLGGLLAWSAAVLAGGIAGVLSSRTGDAS